MVTAVNTATVTTDRNRAESQLNWALAGDVSPQTLDDVASSALKSNNTSPAPTATNTNRSQNLARPAPKLAQGAANFPASYNPRTGTLTPTYPPQANLVNVGGITLPKYPSQADLGALGIGSAYPSRAIAKLDPTVYVLDNFVLFDVTVGTGASQVAITHGATSLAIVKAGLPDVKVVPVNAAMADGKMDDDSIAAGLRNIIAIEAKRQNTATPDLSRAFVSMSLGQTQFTSVPNPNLQAAISQFTRLGGTFYGSAGNGFTNTTAFNQGVGIVYASRDVVGSNLGNNPTPAGSLASGSYTFGNVSSSRIQSNALASSSHAYVGAGQLRQRYNPNTGGVEMQNAQGRWVAAIPASQVRASPAAGAKAKGPLDGQRTGRPITAAQAKDFAQWQNKQAVAAIDRHPMPAGSKRLAEYSDLSTQEKDQLSETTQREFRRRFGNNAVMSVAEFKAANDIQPGSETAQILDQALPSSLTPATTFVAAEGPMLSFSTARPSEFSVYFYKLDANGSLATLPAYSASSTSTSAATPDLVVRAVKYRALQLEAAQLSRSRSP
jgi:hypothetical protein